MALAIGGQGQITSRDGSITCGPDSAPTPGCQVKTFVGWNDDASSTTYQLCAVPVAGSGDVFDSWSFAVSADCPGCDAADPEMGAIETHGNEADVRIDMNAGYDVDELVTANFVASGTTSPSAANTTCW